MFVLQQDQSLVAHMPSGLLEDALEKFDDHFQNMVADILRVGCLAEDQWEQASPPVRLSGFGVNQTMVIAGSAFVGSCALTKDLVAQLLGKVRPRTNQIRTVGCTRNYHGEFA